MILKIDNVAKDSLDDNEARGRHLSHWFFPAEDTRCMGRP